MQHRQAKALDSAGGRKCTKAECMETKCIEHGEKGRFTGEMDKSSGTNGKTGNNDSDTKQTRRIDASITTFYSQNRRSGDHSFHREVSHRETMDMEHNQDNDFVSTGGSETNVGSRSNTNTYSGGLHQTMPKSHWQSSESRSNQGNRIKGTDKKLVEITQGNDCGRLGHRGTCGKFDGHSTQNSGRQKLDVHLDMSEDITVDWSTDDMHSSPGRDSRIFTAQNPRANAVYNRTSEQPQKTAFVNRHQMALHQTGEHQRESGSRLEDGKDTSMDTPHDTGSTLAVHQQGYNYRRIRLNSFFESDAEPSNWCPIDVFFYSKDFPDSGHRVRQIRSLTVIDRALELYVPEMKQISLQFLDELCSTSVNWLKLRRWLCDPELYTSLLRPREKRTRPVFQNEMTASDLSKIIEAGVLEPTSQKPKAYCNIFSVPEVAKNRRRLIIEPRLLNDILHSYDDVAYTRILPRVQLPKIFEIQQAAATSQVLEQIDATCFYYQIPLHPDVSQFFGARINGEVYVVRRLPMGAVCSVAIAQEIMIGLERRIYECGAKFDRSFVYIDNIFWFHDGNLHVNPVQLAGEIKIGTHERGSKGTVLGMELDLGISVRLSLKFRKKHEECIHQMIAWGNTAGVIEVRLLWKWLGILMHASRVVRIPMCNYFYVMKTLQHVSIELAFEKLDWSSHIIVPEVARRQIRQLASEIGKWKTVGLPTEQQIEYIVFSDADNYRGGAIVLIRGQRILIQEYNAHPTINENEAEAARMALRLCPMYSPGLLVTDSKVLHDAFARGQSRNKVINAAVASMTQWNVALKWIPSLENPADEISRDKELCEEKLVRAQESCGSGTITSGRWAQV